MIPHILLTLRDDILPGVALPKGWQYMGAHRPSADHYGGDAGSAQIGGMGTIHTCKPSSYCDWDGN